MRRGGDGCRSRRQRGGRRCKWSGWNDGRGGKKGELNVGDRITRLNLKCRTGIVVEQDMNDACI